MITFVNFWSYHHWLTMAVTVANAGMILTAADMTAFPEEPTDAAMTPHTKYHANLVSLMSFTFNQSFGRRQLWSADVLRSLTPYHIVRWMNNMLD